MVANISGFTVVCYFPIYYGTCDEGNGDVGTFFILRCILKTGVTMVPVLGLYITI